MRSALIVASLMLVMSGASVDAVENVTSGPELDYQAAVLSAGFTSISLGSTATAVHR